MYNPNKRCILQEEIDGTWVAIKRYKKSRDLKKAFLTIQKENPSINYQCAFYETPRKLSPLAHQTIA